MDMVTEYIDFLKYDRRHLGEKTYTLECECMWCKKPFEIEKRGKGYRRILREKSLVCCDCWNNKVRSDSYYKGRDTLMKVRAEKKESNQKEFKSIEEEEVKHLIHTPKELEDWIKEGHRSCTCICEDCGKEHILPNRRLLVKYGNKHSNDKKLLCKGCSISQKKKRTIKRR